MTAKDISGFVKSKAKGTIKFYPFENLGDAAMQEIRRFQVYPFGNIEDFCRHIPYNSGKKDFFEKTGRESFEGGFFARRFEGLGNPLDLTNTCAVFQYSFKLPGDESDYIVMWDYNIGLVRMTPFFKCCKYSKVSLDRERPCLVRGLMRGKTTPAKMLNMNPGLRDITHSITGGSIMAQGKSVPDIPTQIASLR